MISALSSAILFPVWVSGVVDSYQGTQVTLDAAIIPREHQHRINSTSRRRMLCSGQDW